MKHRRKFSIKDTNAGRYFLIYTRSGKNIYLTFAKLEYEDSVIVAKDALPKYLELHSPFGDDITVNSVTCSEFGFQIKTEYDIYHTVYELNENEIINNNIVLETI